MNWQEVCENKQLQDLPFKIELNRWGQVVMGLAKPKHSFYQGRIQSLLELSLKIGVAVPELAVQTADGVKVVDFAWFQNND